MFSHLGFKICVVGIVRGMLLCSVCVAMSWNVQAKAAYATSKDCERVEHHADPRAEVAHVPQADVNAEPKVEWETQTKPQPELHVDLQSSLQDRLDPRKYNFPSGNETRFPVAGITMNRHGVFSVKTVGDDIASSAQADAHGCGTRIELK
jgi:hypothetical protein